MLQFPAWTATLFTVPYTSGEGQTDYYLVVNYRLVFSLDGRVFSPGLLGNFAEKKQRIHLLLVLVTPSFFSVNCYCEIPGWALHSQNRMFSIGEGEDDNFQVVSCCVVFSLEGWFASLAILETLRLFACFMHSIVSLRQPLLAFLGWALHWRESLSSAEEAKPTTSNLWLIVDW
jgi:hypothetical protein